MSAVTTLPLRPDGWTVADLELLPDDPPFRYELVVRREALQRKYAQPGEALLAVEVMSPSSVSTDRVTKPAQFAAAGIPHFWRFEPAEQVLWTYRLDGDVYRETGQFTDEVDITEPVPLRFRLADLVA